MIDENSVTTIFSTGKIVGKIMLSLMHNQGRIKYEEKVSTYWPEFAQNGKENVTVADVCRHEGGLYMIPGVIKDRIPPEYFLTENIKKNMVG